MSPADLAGIDRLAAEAGDDPRLLESLRMRYRRRFGNPDGLTPAALAQSLANEDGDVEIDVPYYHGFEEAA